MSNMPQLSTPASTSSTSVDPDTPMGNTGATTTSNPTTATNNKNAATSSSSQDDSWDHQQQAAQQEFDDTETESNVSTPTATTSKSPMVGSDVGEQKAIIQPPTVPTKRHRVRSRSMPNLSYTDPTAKIHKPAKRHEFLNPKYLSTSSLPSSTSSSSSSSSSPNSASESSISPLQHTAGKQSSQSSSSSSRKHRKPHHHHHHKRSSGSISPPSALCPNAPIQAPPVNAHSLREIDLQEIFKNPQLRHDIIFDPQLQFRPNLDGERGKRKRMITERYWDSVINEFQDLAENNNTNTLVPNSKLPLMFHTLRDILLSLLPVKDRSYVDSVLDPDLMIQQIRHCALDFYNLAKWLAGVFKAHCAPMRDSWVDQMVSRIELGIESRSPRRLVEGLRMIFAILEAMKLDVANHQIRTLRPMLVDTAIEFEQDYYTQIIEKGKTNLNDSLEWFKNGCAKFKESGLPEGPDTNRSAFILTLLKLLSCSSDQVVSEFPSTFGFDFSRLAGFRAELRKVVCLHLCVCLYQQMINQEAKGNKVVVAEALSSANIEKFKQDLLAIIEDSVGNSKWTKNTHTLALEISKRVDVAMGRKLSVPSKHLLDVCSGWLAKHLQPRSELYKLLENKTIVGLFGTLNQAVSVLSPLDSTTTCTNNAASSTATTTTTTTSTTPVSKEIVSLADRILVLVRFHWGVFGKFYVAYVTRDAKRQKENEKARNEDDSNAVESCLIPPSTSMTPALKERNRELTQVRQSSTSSSTC